jgi:hypothetical protein
MYPDEVDGEVGEIGQAVRGEHLVEGFEFRVSGLGFRIHDFQTRFPFFFLLIFMTFPKY